MAVIAKVILALSHSFSLSLLCGGLAAAGRELRSHRLKKEPVDYVSTDFDKNLTKQKNKKQKNKTGNRKETYKDTVKYTN